MLSKAGSTFALVLAAGVSVISLAACGSGGSTAAGGAPAASGTVSSAPAASSPAVSSPAASSPAASSPADTPASTPECKAGQLEIAYTDNAQIRDGALDGMSKVDSVLTFTNTGGTTCVIQGYPGVAALNAGGSQIMQAVRQTAPVNSVFLKPGEAASTLVAANSASCTTLTKVAGLLVTAPDQYSSTRLTSGAEMCLPSLTVSPVVAGNAAGLPV
jgi:hypothetical protein